MNTEKPIYPERRTGRTTKIIATGIVKLLETGENEFVDHDREQYYLDYGHRREAFKKHILSALKGLFPKVKDIHEVVNINNTPHGIHIMMKSITKTPQL